MQFKFFGLLASLAMLVGCAINHSGSLPVEFQPALEPSRFFEQALEATVGVDRSSVAINFADEAIGRMKDTATKRAEDEFSSVTDDAVALSKDCYADVVCFNLDMTVKALQTDKASWTPTLEYLDSYFLETQTKMRRLDEAVADACDEAAKLRALLERDRVLRAAYSNTLNDPTLVQYSELAPILAVAWIRSQVRLRDILAASWLENKIAGLPPQRRLEILQNGWLIVQHADRKPAFQFASLEALSEGSFARSKPKEWSMLVDRVALNRGKPQVYGTQVRCIMGEYRRSPTIDDSKVNRRRREIGLEPLKTSMTEPLGVCSSN